MIRTLADAIITDTYERMSQTAAEYVLEAVQGKPDSVICVATGASPVGVYAELSRHPEDLRQVRILKLDEWGGLPPDDPSTCEVYIEKHVLTPWNVSRDRYEGFRSDAPDAEAECQRIHQRIQELGGIDIAVLGMGADGHIGLNYPDDWIPALAHPADSCALKHAMLKAAQSAPTHGLTLGMVEILSARRIILVVNGVNKAEAVELLMSRKLSTYFPASFLWMHNEVFFVLDRPATLYT